MKVNSTASTRLVIVVILALAFLLAPSAGAQQGPPDSTPGNGPPDSTPGSGPPSNPDHPCYPDGCGPRTTTTAPPSGGPSCGISLETAVVGAEVRATVRNVPPGGTVRLLFAGNEVARGTNESEVQPIRAMPTQAADVVMTFTVPDLPPGVYTVVAVGDTFTVTCGGGGFEILAAASGGGGALAFTGTTVLYLLALALALLVAGYLLKRRGAARARS